MAPSKRTSPPTRLLCANSKYEGSPGNISQLISHEESVTGRSEGNQISTPRISCIKVLVRAVRPVSLRCGGKTLEEHALYAGTWDTCSHGLCETRGTCSGDVPRSVVFVEVIADKGNHNCGHLHFHGAASYRQRDCKVPVNHKYNAGGGLCIS